VNTARENWLNEIDDCEKSNLSEIKEIEIEETKIFCFLIEFYGDVLESGRFTWRLISTDMYHVPQTGPDSMLSRYYQFSHLQYKLYKMYGGTGPRAKH
jgi:hypothetical protein